MQTLAAPNNRTKKCSIIGNHKCLHYVNTNIKTLSYIFSPNTELLKLALIEYNVNAKPTSLYEI